MNVDSGGNPLVGNFEGIRVIDFAHILAGPYCCKLLADMGAEVIKVEMPPTGERSRGLPHIKNGASGFYMWRNGGKKDICLNMKHPKGLEAFMDLVKISDVVVQNHRVGMVERLGIGYEDLKKVNPRIIMCSISGYGQYGPLSDWPANDANLQAMSGAMDITGYADGPPVPSWVPWVDFGTGTHALVTVGAALYHRDRTGIGQHIDIAMLDCAFAWHGYHVTEYLLTDGQSYRSRTGPMHPYNTPSGVYTCRDGYLLVSATNDTSWRHLTELLGRAEMATDPRYNSAPKRDANKEYIDNLVAEWIKNYDVNEAHMLLEQAGVLSTIIPSIEEVVNHPQIEAREMLVEFDHPQAGKFKMPNSPFKFSGTEAKARGRAPMLGEHNEEVLTNLLGYSKERIAHLWEEKVLHAEPDALG